MLLLGTICSLASAQAMKHPGVLVSRQQLDFVKRQVKAKKEPYLQPIPKGSRQPVRRASDYKLLGPPETGIIDCGAYSRPDHGCHAEDTDASAAYLQAVLWWITRDHRYAANAIRIMNAYSQKVKGYTNANTHLQAAWSAEMWPRSRRDYPPQQCGMEAERHPGLQRHAYQNQPAADSRRSAKEHRQLGVEHDRGHDGHCGVHRRSCAAESCREHVAQLRVPSYFYNAKIDGDHPVVVEPGPHEGWFGQTTLRRDR